MIPELLPGTFHCTLAAEHIPEAITCHEEELILWQYCLRGNFRFSCKGPLHCTFWPCRSFEVLEVMVTKSTQHGKVPIEIPIRANMAPSSPDAEGLFWVRWSVVIGQLNSSATPAKNCSAIPCIGHHELVPPDEGSQSCRSRTCWRSFADWCLKCFVQLKVCAYECLYLQRICCRSFSVRRTVLQLRTPEKQQCTTG